MPSVVCEIACSLLNEKMGRLTSFPRLRYACSRRLRSARNDTRFFSKSSSQMTGSKAGAATALAACVLLFAAKLSAAQTAEAGAANADVVVYGGTSAGVTAAVQAARMGRSVVLIEPGKHL